MDRALQTHRRRAGSGWRVEVLVCRGRGRGCRGRGSIRDCSGWFAEVVGVAGGRGYRRCWADLMAGLANASTMGFTSRR